MAFMLAMLLFSLAGIPPLAGFFAKFYVFLAAIESGLYVLAVIGVLASVVGAYYYLRIVKIMYFDEPVGGFAPMPTELKAVLGVSGAFILFFIFIAGRSAPPRSWPPRRSSSSFDGVPLPTGYRREHHDSLASTNAHALAAARSGAAGGLWVTAGEQTAGRGRRGRAWTTGAGNLAASLMLIDPAPRALAPTVSFVAAVALHQAVVDVAGPAAAERLALKWPNDLLLDRTKVAGILVEGEALPSGAFAVVIGIGVNCVSHPDVTEGQAAGDLGARGLPVDAEALFARLAIRMDEELRLWDRGRGFADVRTAWLARAVGIGEPIRVNLADGAVAGRFEALDEAGRLVLAREDGERQSIGAGDVFLSEADRPNAARPTRRTGLPAARRGRRDRHEPRALRLWPAPRPHLARGRFRRLLRPCRPARRRSRLPRHRLSRGGAHQPPRHRRHPCP